MNQPAYTECTGETIDLPTTDEPNPGIAAAWMIVALFVVVAIFEVWALRTKHNTISHLIQRVSRGRTWFKWLAGAGMAILTWHLVWGF